MNPDEQPSDEGDIENLKTREQWLQENQHALMAYNHRVEEYGCFSDGLRSF